MKQKTLIETNPYLRDSITRAKLVAQSVRTSCGVEGMTVALDEPHIEILYRRPKKIYQQIK